MYSSAILNSPMLPSVKHKAVKINPYLLSVEKTAAERVFKIWANFILKKGGPANSERRTRVNIFRWYFPFAILVIAPLKYVFFLIFASHLTNRDLFKPRWQVPKNLKLFI